MYFENYHGRGSGNLYILLILLNEVCQCKRIKNINIKKLHTPPHLRLSSRQVALSFLSLLNNLQFIDVHIGGLLAKRTRTLQFRFDTCRFLLLVDIFLSWWRR